MLHLENMAQELLLFLYFQINRAVLHAKTNCFYILQHFIPLLLSAKIQFCEKVYKSFDDLKK